ncbi:hypothetical protein ACKWNT_25110, partial [Escherichia coli]|nr:hypothetical protein [Escherichia coli]
DSLLQMIDTTYRRSSSLYCHQTTDRIGTGLRANPVCGERLVHLTEVTAIWVLTGEHLTGEITAEELC